MSLRVTQSRATSAYWLFAGAGLAGMIALSVAVFLTPIQKPEVPSKGPAAASVAKAAWSTPSPTVIEHSPNGTVPNAAGASKSSVVIEAQEIAPSKPAHSAHVEALPVAKPVIAPEAGVSTKVATNPLAPQTLTHGETQTAHVTAKVAQLPAALPPKASPSNTPPPASSSNRINVPTPPPIQQAPARQAETIVVKGYQQMALNVDAIGRGNSLTIQLPLAKRK